MVHSIIANARFRLFAAAVACLMLLGIGSTPAHAGGPGGSWTKSCTEQSVDVANKVIRGYCGMGGNLGFGFLKKSRHTSLIRYDLCVGDISNDHGHLTCNRGANGWGMPLSASLTCRESFQVGGRLHAKCKRKTNSWNWTSVASTAAACKSATNSDGILSCSTVPASGGSSSSSGGVPLPVKMWTLCVSKSGFSQTVTYAGQTPDQAIAAYRTTLPNNGVEFLVTSGACL